MGQIVMAEDLAGPAAVAVVLAMLMVRTFHGDQVYWFAGFRPARGIAIGIDFAVGPLSAGLACLAALLVTAAMVFSWRYFEEISTYNNFYEFGTDKESPSRNARSLKTRPWSVSVYGEAEVRGRPERSFVVSSCDT